ncbi:MAG: hypothetical protein JWR19_2155 [Pedosphaera sp.]|nr:hypothetical protein [Pedosphaera sp.]
MKVMVHKPAIQPPEQIENVVSLETGSSGWLKIVYAVKGERPDKNKYFAFGQWKRLEVFHP